MKQLIQEHYGKVAIVAATLSLVIAGGITYVSSQTSLAITLDPCIDNDQDGYGQTTSPMCPHTPIIDCDDTDLLKNDGIPGSCTAQNENLNSQNGNSNDGNMNFNGDGSNVNINGGNNNENVVVNDNTNSVTNTNSNEVTNNNTNGQNNENDNSSSLTDTDQDGVPDTQDLCANTALTELNVPTFPTQDFGVGRYLLINGQFLRKTAQSTEPSPYTLQQTRGCACKQILTYCEDGETYGEGEMKYGCSEGILKNWIEEQGKTENKSCKKEEKEHDEKSDDHKKSDDDKKNEKSGSSDHNKSHENSNTKSSSRGKEGGRKNG